jgi:hypothetical protein
MGEWNPGLPCRSWWTALPSEALESGNRPIKASSVDQMGLVDCARSALPLPYSLRPALWWGQLVAILLAENNRLTAENARLRAMLNPDATRARSETEQQVRALRGALMPLLAQPTGTMNS